MKWRPLWIAQAGTLTASGCTSNQLVSMNAPKAAGQLIARESTWLTKDPNTHDVTSTQVARYVFVPFLDHWQTFKALRFAIDNTNANRQQCGPLPTRKFFTFYAFAIFISEYIHSNLFLCGWKNRRWKSILCTSMWEMWRRRSRRRCRNYLEIFWKSTVEGIKSKLKLKLDCHSSRNNKYWKVDLCIFRLVIVVVKYSASNRF